MKNKIISCILGMGLLLSACTTDEGGLQSEVLVEKSPIAQEAVPVQLDELLEIANTRRQSIQIPEISEQMINGWHLQSQASLQHSSTDIEFSPDNVYTYADVADDIEYLFLWFENIYAPYYYFGGTERYGIAKQAILDDVNTLENITGQALEEILHEHLSFMVDSHVSINWEPVTAPSYGFIGDIAFVRGDGGLMEVTTGKGVSTIGGVSAFDKNMVLSVDGNGAVFFRYCVFTTDGSLSPVEVCFEDGSTVQMELVNAHELAGSPNQPDGEFVSLDYVGEIPIITVRNMGFDQSVVEAAKMEADLFLEYAEQFQSEPVLIVDLRDNGGGNTYLPYKWMEIYAGQRVYSNYASLIRYDFYPALGEVETQTEADENSMFYVPSEEQNYYDDTVRVNDSWAVTTRQTNEVIENEGRLLIVLTNKNTASSADIFTDLAFSIENTLVIGSNTCGKIISNQWTGDVMPKTGIIFTLGNSLNLFDASHFQETVGFQPDVWAAGDARSAAVAIVERFLERA